MEVRAHGSTRLAIRDHTRNGDGPRGSHRARLVGHEGRWGNGGGYWPKATYEYVVDGITYTSDRWAYAFDGLKHVVAEQMLAELPDQVDVHYDPTAPRIAYLQKRPPRLGYLLVGGGVVGVVVALGSLLG